MKIKMTRKEQLAIEYAKKFSKNWDYWLQASNGYMEGYRQARLDAQQFINSFDEDYGCLPQYVDEVGEEKVEVEFKDGEHQLAPLSFKKWEELK